MPEGWVEAPLGMPPEEAEDAEPDPEDGAGIVDDAECGGEGADDDEED